MILTVRTDSPFAEIGLWDKGQEIEIYRWEAGRQLSLQLLEQIEQLLSRRNSSFGNLIGLVAFKGPGSFTALRIGTTVANTIAYAQNIPIIGTAGDSWRAEGLSRLQNNENHGQVIPEYGAPANVTKPK